MLWVKPKKNQKKKKKKRKKERFFFFFYTPDLKWVRYKYILDECYASGPRLGVIYIQFVPQGA